MAAALEGFQGVLADRPQGHVDLHGIGFDENRPGLAAAADRRLLPSTTGKEIGHQVVDQRDQLDRLEIGPRRPGKEHHVGDHLVDPHRLGTDQRQRVLALGIGLFAEQELGTAGDDRQRIIDLVAGPGGELGQRFELLDLERPLEIGLQFRQSGELVGDRRRSFYMVRHGMRRRCLAGGLPAA